MIKFLHKKYGDKGQSIIEYALLIVLVLAGVYVMSPYVIRSWNANVKGWEDSVKDSYQDPIGAAPPGVIDISGTCNYELPCSSPPCCGFGDCEEYETTHAWMCNPLGYLPPPGGVQYQCDRNGPDATCCSVPVQLRVPEDCNTLTDSVTGLPCGTDEVPALYTCGGDPNHNIDPSAPGFDPNNFRIECQYNRNCEFFCDNPPNIGDPEYAPAICPSDDLNLSVTINVQFVEEGKCSSPVGSAPKCQWECASSFVPGFGATSCECPAGSINQSGICVIDCTLSQGDCVNRVPPPSPPDPTGCAGLTYDDCNTYGSACQWNPLTLTCSQHTACSGFLTNVALQYPTPSIDNAFARCEFFPWCQWAGGGGFCCMAVQQNACGAGLTDDTGCSGADVLGCCQFDVAGSCRSNGLTCSVNAECCSDNCAGAAAPGGPFCCAGGAIGICDAASSNSGDCCAGAGDCIGGACLP